MDFNALPKVVAIVGSREFPEAKKHWITKCVASLNAGTIVVSGGARGVDSWAEQAVKEIDGLSFKAFYVAPFEWELLGKSVGYVRNEILVIWVKRFKGAVVIFALKKDIDAKTGGSYNVKKLCETLDVPYFLYTA